jgi:predicted Zn-dependent peptidase
LIVVDRPGAPQASVFYGAPIAAIGAPEHLAQMILRALLGGMRSSAFESRVRYEMGATWFGSAMMDVRAAGGILWWEASVAREQSASVLAALERYLRDLRDRGPAPTELEAAKSFVLRALESAGGVAGELAQIAAYRLPLDHLSTLRARIDAVSTDGVRAAVPEPGTMKAVIVGDLASLQGPLLNLGWGPIEVHDGDGKLLRTIER